MHKLNIFRGTQSSTDSSADVSKHSNDSMDRMAKSPRCLTSHQGQLNLLLYVGSKTSRPASQTVVMLHKHATGMLVDNLSREDTPENLSTT